MDARRRPTKLRSVCTPRRFAAASSSAAVKCSSIARRPSRAAAAARRRAGFAAAPPSSARRLSSFRMPRVPSTWRRRGSRRRGRRARAARRRRSGRSTAPLRPGIAASRPGWPKKPRARIRGARRVRPNVGQERRAIVLEQAYPMSVSQRHRSYGSGHDAAAARAAALVAVSGGGGDDAGHRRRRSRQTAERWSRPPCTAPPTARPCAARRNRCAGEHRRDEEAGGHPDAEHHRHGIERGAADVGGRHEEAEEEGASSRVHGRRAWCSCRTFWWRVPEGDGDEDREEGDPHRYEVHRHVVLEAHAVPEVVEEQVGREERRQRQRDLGGHSQYGLLRRQRITDGISGTADASSLATTLASSRSTTTHSSARRRRRATRQKTA